MVETPGIDSIKPGQPQCHMPSRPPMRNSSAEFWPSEFVPEWIERGAKAGTSAVRVARSAMVSAAGGESLRRLS